MSDRDSLPDAGVGADVPIDRDADPDLLADPDARAILEALRSARDSNRGDVPLELPVEAAPALQERALDDVAAPAGTWPGSDRPDPLTPMFEEPRPRA